MLLMEEAERIAREEHGANKLAVISGRDSSIVCCRILWSSPCSIVSTRDYGHIGPMDDCA